MLSPGSTYSPPHSPPCSIVLGHAMRFALSGARRIGPLSSPLSVGGESRSTETFVDFKLVILWSFPDADVLCDSNAASHDERLPGV